MPTVGSDLPSDHYCRSHVRELLFGSSQVLHEPLPRSIAASMHSVCGWIGFGQIRAVVGRNGLMPRQLLGDSRLPGHTALHCR